MWTENQKNKLLCSIEGKYQGKRQSDCDICTICLKKEIHKNYRSFYVLSMGTDL